MNQVVVQVNREDFLPRRTTEQLIKTITPVNAFKGVNGDLSLLYSDPGFPNIS